MSSKRFFYILLACLGLLVITGIGTVVFGVSSLEKSAKTLNDLKVETNIIDEQQNSLSRAKRDIEKYAELEKIAKTIVPQEKDQARTVREIIKLADEAGVAVTSVDFPASELGTDKPATTTTAKSKTAPAVSPITQVVPVEGIKGVYQLEVAIQNDAKSLVRYESLINFLSKLEQNRRTAQITNVTISPDSGNRNLLTYSMKVNVYIKP